MLHYMSMKLGRASSIREVYRQKDVQQGGCFILFIGVVYAVLMSENSDLDLYVVLFPCLEPLTLCCQVLSRNPDETSVGGICSVYLLFSITFCLGCHNLDKGN